MRRTASVVSEDIDIDVCIGDYDGFKTIEVWFVDFYVDGERIVGNTYKEEWQARQSAKWFEDGIYLHGEHKELIFPFDGATA